MTLDVEPTYDVRQDVFTGLSWDALASGLEAVTSSAYSVSLFTRWGDSGIDQVWLKSRGDRAPAAPSGAVAAASTMHMLDGADIDAVTAQGGVPGPWLDRLPHFRMGFTPSRGAEPRASTSCPASSPRPPSSGCAASATGWRPCSRSASLRTVAADGHWLSGSHGHDVLAVHFTWVRDVERVYAVLPAIEAALLPLGARPHWGKCFAAGVEEPRAALPADGRLPGAAAPGRPRRRLRQRLPRPRHRLSRSGRRAAGRISGACAARGSRSERCRSVL